MDITKSTPDKQTPTTSRKSRPNTNSNTLLASTTSLIDTYVQDCQQQPCSPASSSTSQTTGDTTFEPSIDMMVNDFDDEQTLTEEEALAEQEAQDPADEIATLQKESEIPLEELLAQYRHVEQDHQPEQQQKPQKRKDSMKKSRLRKQPKKHNVAKRIPTINILPIEVDEVIVIEESDDEGEGVKTEHVDTDVGEDGSVQEDNQNGDDDDVDDDVEFVGEEEVVTLLDGDSQLTGRAVDFSKRSHLLELYPEKFANIQHKLDDDLSDEDDDEDDLDYVKKTIMVGPPYQATIPVGLSKYGDVLPYENEDKLIWEPSQVSEQEVEDYLIRVREIKSLLPPDEEIPSSSASVTSESDQGLGSNLIKDDEQALHLLVQCGYNFKEALRRKRLNAVPLTGSMSLWSEEECRNFEEGIQKFGKDFRKIRQTQVRTRSIRELVQFYYLWKKTDRRDQDFVDSDTVDHMDIYLDYDERDTGSNGGGKHISSSLINESYLTNQTFPTKKQHHSGAASSTLSNFSIMNETKRLAACSSNDCKKTPRKKRSRNDAAAHRRRSSLLAANKAHHHSDSNSSFTTKCTLESSSSQPAAAVSPAKNSRNSNNATGTSSSSTTPSSTISSTTGNGNHSNKK